MEESSEYSGVISGVIREKALQADQNASKKKPSTCYYCGEEGHFRRDCSSWKNAQKEKQQNVATARESNGDAIGCSSKSDLDFGLVAKADVTEVSKLFWMVDSGATIICPIAKTVSCATENWTNLKRLFWVMEVKSQQLVLETYLW